MVACFLDISWAGPGPLRGVFTCFGSHGHYIDAIAGDDRHSHRLYLYIVGSKKYLVRDFHLCDPSQLQELGITQNQAIPVVLDALVDSVEQGIPVDLYQTKLTQVPSGFASEYEIDISQYDGWLKNVYIQGPGGGGGCP
ncbi:MAG: hypothetical protein R3A45_08495 [Bdellovibrionota bacterium]